MRKFNLFLIMVAVCCLTASAQYQHEPMDGDPYADQPAYQADFQWNDSTLQWDSLRYGTLAHHPVGKLPDVVFRPTVGSTMTNLLRYTRQYDAQGNLTLEGMDEDLTGQGGWVPFLRLRQEFLPNTNLITKYLMEIWNGVSFDTTTANLYTYNLNGPGGQPLEKYASYYANGTWSSPYVYERYHYSASQEMDTLWYNPYWADSNGYEKHVFHSWHDYASRLVDSATVYVINNFGPHYELYGTHRTYYSGNTPQRYRHDKYELGTAVERRILTLTSEGFFGLDSIVTLVGPPTLVYKGQYQNSFDPQQRYTMRIKLQNQGPLPMVPMTMAQYFYLATTAVDGAEIQLDVWPNPASDRLKIALPTGVDGTISLQLVDMNGRVRISQVQEAGASVIELDLGEELPTGTYLLRVHTTQGDATHKVIVSR